MGSLQNKVAVITGAANGLGKALAKELYKQGCDLALIDIDAPGLQEVQKALTGSGQISIHKADIAIEADVGNVYKEVLAQHNRVDILINNAAIANGQLFEQVDMEDFRKLFDVNFWAVVYCSRHFLPALLLRNGSMLVNIISEFAYLGLPGKITYGSSKSAIMGFSNSLKTELSGTNVRLSLVVPPPMKTDLVKSGRHIDEHRKMIEDTFLKKKGMHPDKAAKIIVRQMKSGTYRIFVGPMMYWMDVLIRLFPTPMHYLIGKYKKRIGFV